MQADRVFKAFRAGFIGKCSPVHFFWGGPDLAVTRFSGRRAPEHPGGIPNLRLTGDGEGIAFEVRDDGRGFDPATTPRGAGLTNMTDRIGAVGGTLAVRSALGEGTTVQGAVTIEADDRIGDVLNV